MKNNTNTLEEKNSSEVEDKKTVKNEKPEKMKPKKSFEIPLSHMATFLEDDLFMDEAPSETEKDKKVGEEEEESKKRKKEEEKIIEGKKQEEKKGVKFSAESKDEKFKEETDKTSEKETISSKNDLARREKDDHPLIDEPEKDLCLKKEGGEKKCPSAEDEDNNTKKEDEDINNTKKEEEQPQLSLFLESLRSFLWQRIFNFVNDYREMELNLQSNFFPPFCKCAKFAP